VKRRIRIKKKEIYVLEEENSIPEILVAIVL
jgi:hypothetical protein